MCGAKNDDFLKTYYIDAQNEMRWRREVEYKLLTNYIAISAFLLPAEALLYKEMASMPHRMLAATCITIAVFVLTIGVSLKIRAENTIYKALGRNVVAIWEYFEMFSKGTYLSSQPMLPKNSRQYGQGSGYKRTLYVLWSLTVTVSVLSFVLAVFMVAHTDAH